MTKKRFTILEQAQILFDRNIEYMNAIAPIWNEHYRKVEQATKLHESFLQSKKNHRSPDIEVAKNTSPDNIAGTATKTGTL